MTEVRDKPTILAVDDAPKNLKLLAETLKGDYRVKAVVNCAMALVVRRIG
ncbi:response regulator [Thiorhodovibrio winogradskyi]|nr:hypothetical protein [Thiorhodovibrio winogradskyi]